jgi:mono/diheme cytochrome c family protein
MLKSSRFLNKFGFFIFAILPCAVWAGADEENLSQEELERSAVFKLFDGVKAEEIFVRKSPRDLETKFSDITRFINERTRSGLGSSTVRIPFGRSPEAKVTDLLNPRFVGTVTSPGLGLQQQTLGFGGIGFQLDGEPSVSAAGTKVTFSSTAGAPEIFAAYTPNLDQLELIAWNAERMRYDFFLIKNFSSDNLRRIEAPKRQDCISCHQNETAHFTRLPWNETGTINNRLAQAMSNAHALADVLKKIGLEANSANIDKLANASNANDLIARLKTLKGVSASDGEMIQEIEDLVRSNQVLSSIGQGGFGGTVSDSGAFNIDSNVRLANQRLQAAKVCKSLCAEGDVSCRKALLTAALLPTQGTFVAQVNSFNGGFLAPPLAVNASQQKAATAGIERTLSALKKVWPEDGFSVVSSVLPDRDPLKGGEVEYLFAPDPQAFVKATQDGAITPRGPFNAEPSTNTLQKDAVSTRGLLHYSEFGTRNAPAQAFGPTVDIIAGQSRDPQASPLFPRPRVSAMSAEEFLVNDSLKNFLLGDCFGINPELVASIRKLGPSSIEEIVLGPGEKAISHLLAEKWPRPARLDEVLQAQFNALQDTRRQQLQAAFAKQGETAVLVDELPKDEVHRLVQEKCASCHGPDGRRQRLPLDNLEALAGYKGVEGGLVNYLKDGTMPPAKSPQLTASEKAALLKTLEGVAGQEK